MPKKIPLQLSLFQRERGIQKKILLSPPFSKEEGEWNLPFVKGSLVHTYPISMTGEICMYNKNTLMHHYDPRLKQLARKLRKSMTEAEVIMWQRLRKKQVHNTQFFRQKIIGTYIVDFVAPSKNLIIEIDGGGHFQDGSLIEKDLVREDYLKNQGFTILRFTNTEVMQNIDGVFLKIFDFIEREE
jgi:very-short-patch-repair endonuclease